MLILKGNSAAICLAAKGGLDRIPTELERLQAGIAIMAGLSKPQDVRQGDVIRMVADLHDELIAQGLLARPTLGLLEHMRIMTFGNGPAPSPADLLLGALLSNIRLMRVRTDQDIQLIDFHSELPERFVKNAYALYEKALVVDV